MDRKRVLVVEDEKELVHALKLRLTRHGYDVLAAYDGEEGLAMARKEKPDLIILDIMLPKMDGFKVSEELKYDDRYKDIPIIILTVKAEASDRAKGRDAGAEEYITKPFDGELLLQKIDEYLGKN